MTNGSLNSELISENLCSKEVYMQLDGQAHGEQYTMAGKYTKANGLASGMPYWMQSDGTNALWFVDGRWRISNQSDLGTDIQVLYSTNSPPCPESVGSHWKYFDDGEWLNAQENATMYKYKGMIYQENKQSINGI